MPVPFTRRTLLGAAPGLLLAKKSAPAPAPAAQKSVVSLVHGEDRRKNVLASLEAIDDQLRAKLRTRKSVVIKPNNVSTTRQLAASHADALRGILDYLAPRFKGPVFIAEASAGETMQGFETFKYTDLPKEYRRQNVQLVDLNTEALYQVIHVVNGDIHPQPVRLAARLLDPDAFVISAAMLKTHNVTVATLNIKNMALGAPLHSKRGETPRWNDKRAYHGGVRQTHYDIMLTAQRLQPSFGVGVIDGYEGMEGNGPSAGTPVPSRVAIASADFVAADRIGVECMGINPDWTGYLKWCSKVGVGRWDRDQIELRGVDVAQVRREYRLHADIDRELQWMGPLKELPPKLG
jgi:uncharacterized protein (DUF362 family)